MIRKSLLVNGLGLIFSLGVWADGSLKVLTYNVWGLPLGISKNLNPRLEGFCKVLNENSKNPNGWDVVILQEVWQMDNQWWLTNCGYPYAITLDRHVFDSGLMILSKFPIQKPWRHRFLINGDPNHVFQDGEAISKKSAVMAQIVHPQLGTIWISNMHLVSNYHEPGHTYSDQRAEQMYEFANWAFEVVGSNNLIAGGDFNLAPNYSSYEPLWNEIPNIFRGFNLNLGSKDTCTRCRDNVNSPEDEGKIDHLFLSSNLELKSSGLALNEKYLTSVGLTHLSDHFGWQSEISIKGEPQENLKACGEFGDVANRIRDCYEKNISNQAHGISPFSCGENHSAQVCSEKNWVNWWLVTKNGDHEIWLDANSNIVWTNWLGKMSAQKGRDVCDHLQIPGFKGRFRLPTELEYRVAELNGLRSVAPDFASKWYWLKSKQGYALGSGFSGAVKSLQNPSGEFDLRCVNSYY